MKEMLGRPLLDYTIEYAKKCPLIAEIYVSTDSKEIAEYASKKFGVQAVLRSQEFCGEVIIADVLRHCLSQIPYADKISRVVALQVDHPDRTVNLTDFLQKVVEYDIADAITIDLNGIRNGSIRILRTKDLLERRISYSMMAVLDKCTNIHIQSDFDKAKKNLKQCSLDYSE